MNKKVLFTVRVVLVLILVAPLFMYMYQFFNYLSPDHQRWAEFGSYFSGVYTPILTAFMALILGSQTQSQSRMNKHQIDQDFINRCEKDIEFFLLHLDDYLNTPLPKWETLRKYLILNFSNGSDDALLVESKKVNANAVYIEHHKMIDVWMAIYPLLIGLRTNAEKELPYKLSYNSNYQKILSILSVGVCVSLDNFLYCYRGGVKTDEYLFRSRVIKKEP